MAKAKKKKVSNLYWTKDTHVEFELEYQGEKIKGFRYPLSHERELEHELAISDRYIRIDVTQEKYDQHLRDLDLDPEEFKDCIPSIGVTNPDYDPKPLSKWVAKQIYSINIVSEAGDKYVPEMFMHQLDQGLCRAIAQEILPDPFGGKDLDELFGDSSETKSDTEEDATTAEDS